MPPRLSKRLGRRELALRLLALAELPLNLTSAWSTLIMSLPRAGLKATPVTEELAPASPAWSQGKSALC